MGGRNRGSRTAAVIYIAPNVRCPRVGQAAARLYDVIAMRGPRGNRDIATVIDNAIAGWTDGFCSSTEESTRKFAYPLFALISIPPRSPPMLRMVGSAVLRHDSSRWQRDSNRARRTFHGLT
jgi:hypothetical protein